MDKKQTPEIHPRKLSSLVARYPLQGIVTFSSSDPSNHFQGETIFIMM